LAAGGSNCSTNPEVAKKTAKVMQLVSLVNALPGIVVIGTLGIVSDAYGRKPVLLLGTGVLLISSLVALVTVWQQGSYWYIVLANGISGMTGNYASALVSIPWIPSPFI
jgi:MFS family permease